MAYGTPGIPMVAPPNVGIPPVPFKQPTNLFRYGEQSIWSTQFFDASAGALAIQSSSFRLFSTPIGQNGQGFQPLSIAETSLKEGGRIPAGVAGAAPRAMKPQGERARRDVRRRSRVRSSWALAEQPIERERQVGVMSAVI